MEAVDEDELLAVLAEPVVPVQHGPLRRFEREMRCVHVREHGNGKNCNSSTFFKLMGIPLCMMHALNEMNKMLFERGIDA